MRLNGSSLNRASPNGASAFVPRVGAGLNARGLNSGTLNGRNGPELGAAAFEALQVGDAPVVDYIGVDFGIEVVELPVEQEAFAESGILLFNLEQVNFARGDVIVPIEQQAINVQGVVTVGIEQQNFGKGTAEAFVEQRNFDPADFLPAPGATFLWAAVVTLKGVDVSAALTGQISVEAEEGTARVASFVLKPMAGIVELTDWVGADVSIDYVRLDSITKLPTSTVRIFTGIVDLPEYNTTTRLTSYKCTDNLQQKMEELPRDEIDALVQGRWSDFVFDEEADNFTYANDQLSTVPRSLDQSATGIFRATNWDAKSTPDFTFDASGVVAQETGGGVTVSLENIRKITNEVELAFEYSYERLRKRQIRLAWRFTGTFCDFLRNSLTLPRKEMIEQAANAGSWELESIRFEDLPPSQTVFQCPPGATGGNFRVWLFTPNAALLCLSAKGTMVKKFGQSIREVYPLRIRSTLSQGQLGVIKTTKSRTIRAEYDTDGWEVEKAGAPPVDAFLTQLGGSDDFFNDRDEEAIGNRIDMNAAILTEIDIAKVTLLDAHRRNEVDFTVPMLPTLDLVHTVRLDTTEVDAQGKVKQLVFNMDIERGTALTDVTVAISKRPDGAVNEPVTSVPTVPDTISPMSATVNGISLTSRWGGLNGDTGSFIAANLKSVAGTDDDDFAGYTGNRDPFPDRGSILYRARFNINTEEIDSQDRDEIEVASEDPDVIYEVDIPNDLLVILA